MALTDGDAAEYVREHAEPEATYVYADERGQS